MWALFTETWPPHVVLSLTFWLNYSASFLHWISSLSYPHSITLYIFDEYLNKYVADAVSPVNTLDPPGLDPGNTHTYIHLTSAKLKLYSPNEPNEINSKATRYRTFLVIHTPNKWLVPWMHKGHSSGLEVLPVASFSTVSYTVKYVLIVWLGNSISVCLLEQSKNTEPHTHTVHERVHSSLLKNNKWSNQL